MPRLQLKRGPKGSLPAAAMLAGEAYFTTDRKTLHVANDATTTSPVVPAIDDLTTLAAVNGATDLLLIHDADGAGVKEKKITFDAFKAALNISGSGQAALQFQDEGVNLGAAGTVDTINISGRDRTASRTGNTVTLKSWLRQSVSLPIPNATAPSAVGLAITAVGTATAYSPTNTSLINQIFRTLYRVTVAATTAVAGFRTGHNSLLRGSAAGLGGFRWRCLWMNDTGGTVATGRAFCGLINNTANATDVEPSSQVNIMGFGWDAADANVQVMCNDGAGVATKINTGFPVPTTDASEAYDCELFCDPNAADVNYSIKRVSTGVVVTGTLSTDIPANNTGLATRGYASVGGTSSVIGFGLGGLWIDTDY